MSPDLTSSACVGHREGGDVPGAPPGLSAVILVSDVTECNSFAPLSHWYHVAPTGASAYVVGNRIGPDADTVINCSSGEQFAPGHSTYLFNISAVTWQGFDAVFEVIARNLVEGIKIDNIPVSERPTWIGHKNVDLETQLAIKSLGMPCGRALFKTGRSEAFTLLKDPIIFLVWDFIRKSILLSLRSSQARSARGETADDRWLSLNPLPSDMPEASVSLTDTCLAEYKSIRAARHLLFIILSLIPSTNMQSRLSHSPNDLILTSSRPQTVAIKWNGEMHRPFLGLCMAPTARAYSRRRYGRGREGHYGTNQPSL
jgi:hypothetical protein